MMEESNVRSGNVDFEQLMAESRISDISMQKTVIGVGMKRGNSFVSQVESINEVDKLYTKEEMKITKIVGRIKETHSQMKMSWVLDEVDASKEESQLDITAGTASKKTNPGKFGSSTSSRGRTLGRFGQGTVGGEEESAIEREAKSFMKDKEEYEDFVDEYYDINKMTLDGTQNLMNFLANPEADEELQDIEMHEEDDTTEGANDLMMTPNMTRKNSKLKIMSQFAIDNSPDLTGNSKDRTQLDDIVSGRSKLKTSNDLDASRVKKFRSPDIKDGMKKLDTGKYYSMGMKNDRIPTVSTRFETNRTIENLVSDRTNKTPQGVSKFQKKTLK